jgi:4-hydroxy-3-polyprenylbenzoate decarboxylase
LPKNKPQSKNRPFILGVCGASGQIYARWVVKLLLKHFSNPIHVIVSHAAQKIIPDELKLDHLWTGLPADKLIIEDESNLENKLASGSFPTEGMMICPCSLNTLGCIAAGISDNLIKRAAQVHLKERRKLVIGVREMPMGVIDIKNMLRISAAGGIVTPISPPFYHHPATIDELAEFAAQKLVQLLDDFKGTYQYQEK